MTAFSEEEEKAVERYARIVDIGRRKGIDQVLDYLLNERKITYAGVLLPMKIRRLIANAIASRFQR